MELQDAMRNREPVKRYHHKAPDWRRIIRAIDATRFGPNAGNIFVMKFIIIDDPEKISKISDATTQSFVGTAKYLVVATSDDSKLVRNYGDIGVRYSSQQAGAAIQNFLLSLEEQGLVTAWVRYFHDDKIKRILGIPEKIIVEGVFPIGEPTKIKTRKERPMALENYLYFDKWGNKKMEPQTRVSVDSV